MKVPAYSEIFPLYKKYRGSEPIIWAHTINPNTPIEHIAYTIPKYPNVGLSTNVETMCETIPNPGIIKIYTSGCPKNPNGTSYLT